MPKKRSAINITKSGTPVCCYFLTINNPKVSVELPDNIIEDDSVASFNYDELVDLSHSVYVEEIVGQYERGELAGTLHIQACVKLICPMSYKDAIMPFCPRACVQPCRSWKNSVRYCTKEDTRVQQPYHYLNLDYIRYEIISANIPESCYQFGARFEGQAIAYVPPHLVDAAVNDSLDGKKFRYPITVNDEIVLYPFFKYLVV